VTGTVADLLTLLTSLTKQGAGIFRLKEFDTSTPEGRSRERYRRMALTALASAGARVITMATMLIAVPLTLHYLGSERYGMWMTISSIIAMLGLADFGMGLGLLNSISEAHGQDDRLAAERYVSSGFFMLSGVAALIVLVLAVAYPFIAWQRVFNVQSRQAIQEAGPAMAAFVLCFAANLPLGVVRNIQQGYQEGYFNNLWESAGKLMGLAALLLVIYAQAGLVWLVLALAGTPALALVCNNLELFGFRRPWLRPRFQKADGASAKKVMHAGLFFSLLQVCLILTYSSDNVIIAQFLGPEAVTQYAIPYQMFSLSLIIFNVILAPLWPAYSEALARGDLAWVRKALNRSLKFILLSTGITSILLVVFGKILLNFWVGSKVSPSLLLNLPLGIWMVVLTLGSALSMVLNAANIFYFQIKFVFLTFVIAIILKCTFINKFGLPGMVWGTILSYVLFFIIPYSIFIHKRFYKELIEVNQ
jgi:O-antigen/teichoic acid export membrane protein